jgi:tRNA modification GTPase
VIIRITGPAAIETCRQVFVFPVIKNEPGIVCGSIIIDEELNVDAKLYLFVAPHSYTGEDLAEIHINTNAAAAEVLIESLLNRGLTMAGPGEFTARAYLNGKIDLAQAEAVNEIIVSSNTFQLTAAEKLLSGRLSDSIGEIRSSMIHCLSLVEAGLDFSAEDIEQQSNAELIDRLTNIRQQLEELLTGSIRYENLIDLPAVGVAGAPNAGKSRLLNKLLGSERSIVSQKRKTTRDVLSAPCSLLNCRCVLFDCAGLMKLPEDIIDELAQQAAVEALRNSTLVVFCVDISKTDFTEDISVRQLIDAQVLIFAATKCDLVSEQELHSRLGQLSELFGSGFLATSSKTGAGLDLLRETIDEKIMELEPGFAAGKPGDGLFSEGVRSSVAVTARHKKAVSEAIENVGESIRELSAGNEEIAALMLRAAYQAVSGIESTGGGHIDEKILAEIFSRFCIGK